MPPGIAASRARSFARWAIFIFAHRCRFFLHGEWVFHELSGCGWGYSREVNFAWRAFVDTSNACFFLWPRGVFMALLHLCQPRFVAVPRETPGRWQWLRAGAIGAMCRVGNGATGPWVHPWVHVGGHLRVQRRSGCSHASSSGGGHSLAGEMHAATERMPWQLPLGVPGPFGPAERRLCLISPSKWMGGARCWRGGSFPSPELKSQCSRGGLRG